MFAPIFVPPLAVWIAITYSWHWVFFPFAIPGILLSGLWYLLVKTKPEESRFVSESELKYMNQVDDSLSNECVDNIVENSKFALLDKIIRVKKLKPLATSKEVFTSKNVWCDCLAYFMMVSILYGILTWIPSYLVNEKGFSFMKMGFIAAMPCIGGFVGAIAGGWISDKIFGRRRKPTMLFTALSTVIMMFIMLNIPENQIAVAVGLFFVGLMLNIEWPSFTAYAMGVANKNTYSIAISLINSGGNFGGFVSPMVAGYLLDTTGNFNAVFTYFGICAIIGFVLILMLDEPK